MRSNIERAIDKIVDIVNEAVTAGGMTKDETESLRDALRALVAATLSVK